jgi:Holliday junction DNA helicase RuvA
MYSYIIGKVTVIGPDRITLETHGIGYEILTPNPYEFHLEEEVKVHIHQHVREDALLLYGFQTLEEKTLFNQLLGVKGIGPKSAMAMLASGHPKDIVNAIELGNVKFLSKFPGIGPKASQQIILDLKGKLSIEEQKPQHSDRISEVEDALRALGYKNKEIQRAIKQLDPSKPTETLLRQALSNMLS